MIKDWLFPQLQADGDDFVLQHDRALSPPYRRLEIPEFPGDKLPRRWIGHCGALMAQISS